MSDAAASRALDDTVQRILDYHNRTKHHPHQLARSAGVLDWANQPEPFRTFIGAPRVQLPLCELTKPYDALYRPANGAHPLQLDSLGLFFELALGLSAWKQHKQSRWALRCNPSSGNLHPTEGYVVLSALPGIEAGVYHYVSRDHCLERRCAFSSIEPSPFAGSIPDGTFFVGLTSIHWREAWKYGERAYRYCQHDVGHALATLRFAAAVLGWSTRLIDSIADADVAMALGVDRADDFAKVDFHDREQPDVLVVVQPAEARTAWSDNVPSTAATFRAAAAQGVWSGQANALSRSHVAWAIIDMAAEAAEKPATAPAAVPSRWELPALPSSSTASAAQIIRQRRSCLALDGESSIPAATLYRMLDHLLPRRDVAPWDMFPWNPLVHLALFVHRVVGLPPGLYVFERSSAVHDGFRAATKPEFEWQRAPDCPEHLRLFFLAAGDCRQDAEAVSCHQEIAADGAFSLGMIAEFGDTLRQQGPWWYRRMFWEAGAVGQVLYLEAEAAAIGSTGIGCYFDDAFHKLLGLRGDRFQSLYHFTVGVPVDDPRLITLPAYGHLPAARRVPAPNQPH